MPRISVVITERRKAARATLRKLLDADEDIAIVGEAATELETVAAVGRLEPNVLLLDAAFLDGDSGLLLAAIRRSSPRTRVLVLADDASMSRALEPLWHGARGYLGKSSLTTHLASAVKQLHAGQAWVPRHMVARIMDRLTRVTLNPGTA